MYNDRSQNKLNYYNALNQHFCITTFLTTYLCLNMSHSFESNHFKYNNNLP